MRIKRTSSPAAERHARAVRKLWEQEQQRQREWAGRITSQDPTPLGSAAPTTPTDDPPPSTS